MELILCTAPLPHGFCLRGVILGAGKTSEAIGDEQWARWQCWLEAIEHDKQLPTVTPDQFQYLIIPLHPHPLIWLPPQDPAMTPGVQLVDQALLFLRMSAECDAAQLSNGLP